MTREESKMGLGLDMASIGVSKQDIIREGIARRLAKFDSCHWDDLEDSGEDPIVSLGTKQDYLLRATELMEYEDTQGVVIKVERVLDDDYFDGLEGLAGDRIKQAGYEAVEPLI